MYQPFLISGFKTAKSIGMEPWLSPPDAFPTLENMHVNKGVLEKRLGFSPFAQMKHGAVAQTATSIVGIHTHLQKGMPCLLIMDSKGVAGHFTGRCNFYNPIDETMTDISSDLDDTVIGTDLNEYRCYVSHTSAAVNDEPTTGANYLDYWRATGNTGPAETWTDTTDYTAPIFTGSPSDFFSFLNWQGIGYMVNNVDQIYKWEGRGFAVVPFDIKIDAGDPLANQIGTCRFMFIKDDRIILLDTVELGTWHQNRCRYSPVLQTDFSAAGGGYVDAYTQERICAAGMVGKNIAVYTQGGESGTLWLIKSTGNSDIPLKWERVTTTELCRSPYSGVELKDGLAAIGATNIIFYDGFKIKDLDIPNLRDILDEFNDVYIRSVFGYNQKEKRHLLFTFADASSVKPDHILDYNINENNYTIHKSEQSFFVNCLGGFNDQKVPTLAELDDVVAADGALISEITVDSRAVLGTPKPFTLIGCRNSRVYKWGDGEYDGTNDDNGKIEIKVSSIELNPFVDKGLKVACEKVGFLVDNDSSASFLVSVFKGTSTTAYKTKTISCDGSNDKFWAWIFCDGEIGSFHRFEITHTERGNTPKIHAFMPFFDSASRLDYG